MDLSQLPDWALELAEYQLFIDGPTIQAKIREERLRRIEAKKPKPLPPPPRRCWICGGSGSVGDYSYYDNDCGVLSWTECGMCGATGKLPGFAANERGSDEA